LNQTTLLVKISKWVRHQIRAHLSSVWFPIVWEKIYIKTPSKEDLHLYSIGVKIN
jgi:23S rRNA-/tRNA-specific pseudouridylate synthase